MFKTAEKATLGVNYVDTDDIVEYAEQKHGQWKVCNRTGMSFCSECWDYAVEADTNYCPNCGAKMRGGNDE
jgi:membrane protease subunit (stomatin/prohibitin family)